MRAGSSARANRQATRRIGALYREGFAGSRAMGFDKESAHRANSRASNSAAIDQLARTVFSGPDSVKQMLAWLAWCVGRRSPGRFAKFGGARCSEKPVAASNVSLITNSSRAKGFRIQDGRSRREAGRKLTSLCQFMIFNLLSHIICDKRLYARSPHRTPELPFHLSRVTNIVSSGCTTILRGAPAMLGPGFDLADGKNSPFRGCRRGPGRSLTGRRKSTNLIANELAYRNSHLGPNTA
jgi:hypothetical protein